MNSEKQLEEDQILDDSDDTQSTVALDDHETSRIQMNQLMEPVMLVLCTAIYLCETAIPNVIELHYCRSMINVSDGTCFDNTSKYEEGIQKFAATYQIIKTVIESLLPAFASFSVGPWSDVFGRKPLLLCTVAGFFASYALWTWQTTVPTLSPYFFIISSIPISFTGGLTIFILAAFCYACDITTTETRAVRLGSLQCTLFLGSLLGSLLCRWLSTYNYTLVFGTGAVLCYVLLFYIYFFIEESIVPDQRLRSITNKNPFSIEHVRDMFQMCTDKLSPTVRLTLMLLLTALPLSLVVMIGESMTYLYMQDAFGWNIDEYTILNAVVTIAVALGAYGGLWLFSKKLKIPDLYLLSMATFLRIVGALVMVFSTRVWQVYIARLLGCFVGVTDPLIRSFLSKIIPHEELGKVFSLVAASGALNPIIATFVYNTVYDITVSTYPSAVYLMSSIILLVVLYLLNLTVILHVHPSGKHQDVHKNPREAMINSVQC